MRQGARVRVFVQRRVLLRERSGEDLFSINIQLPELLKGSKCTSLGSRMTFYSMSVMMSDSSNPHFTSRQHVDEFCEEPAQVFFLFMCVLFNNNNNKKNILEHETK